MYGLCDLLLLGILYDGKDEERAGSRMKQLDLERMRVEKEGTRRIIWPFQRRTGPLYETIRSCVRWKFGDKYYRNAVGLVTLLQTYIQARSHRPSLVHPTLLWFAIVPAIFPFVLAALDFGTLDATSPMSSPFVTPTATS